MDVVKTKIKRVDDRVMKKAQELRIWLVGSLILLLFIKAERRPGIVALKEEFYKGYTSLDISGVQMAYVGNFESIGSPAQIENQEDFFDEMHRSWKALNPQDMSSANLLDYQIIGYEIALNKERLILEKKWRLPVSDLHKETSLELVLQHVSLLLRRPFELLEDLL